MSEEERQPPRRIGIKVRLTTPDYTDKEVLLDVVLSSQPLFHVGIGDAKIAVPINKTDLTALGNAVHLVGKQWNAEEHE